jgi:hypothetical protein
MIQPHREYPVFILYRLYMPIITKSVRICVICGELPPANH